MAGRTAQKKLGLASATIHMTLKKTITVFNFAVKRGWLDKNPLRGVHFGTMRNPANDRFIALDAIEKILSACPNQTWRVIVTLARFGGLRPSEIKLLRWCDIAQNTFLVTSPKTAHHAGGDSRRCALFPEIERELDALHAISGAGGNDFIAGEKQHRLIGIQSLAAKIIKKAGLLPIPRFFDNCRHSRSIELRNDPNIGCWLSAKMLGHSLKIADSNYSGIREEDYGRIAKKVTQSQQNLCRYSANNSAAKPSEKPEEKLLIG